jgi:hypothetical protein
MVETEEDQKLGYQKGFNLVNVYQHNAKRKLHGRADETLDLALDTTLAAGA